MKKLVLLVILILSALNFFAQADSVKYLPDGPYVFYRNNKIEVKYITSTGFKTEEYIKPEEVKLFCPVPGETTGFEVKLKGKHNVEPSEYIIPKKFVAFSDIEGNFEAFVSLLKNAGVMNDKFNWIFGNGHLFLNGDMFDRGENVTECLWLLYRLESLAEKKGGKVHFILGNHDVMNLIFDFRFSICCT